MSKQQKKTVSVACEQARQAFTLLSGLAPGERAGLLDALAAALDARRDEILKTCADETALTIEELTPEFARMTGTLRMFAALAREGSWVRAAVDTKQTQGLVGPNHDIRSMLVPLGPVAVFGSSNFPLAYGVCGGDTASALAAGCPVVVKEHPAHPRTGRLLAEIARDAAKGAGFDGELVGYVFNEDPRDYSVAGALVRDAAIAAVGFTGSVSGGLALEKIARERRVPIPVFAEMGSSNIVVVTRSAAAERGVEIMREIAASMLVRVGQQCTNTGLVLIDRAGVPRAEAKSDRLVEALRDALLSGGARRMLTESVARTYSDRIDDIAAGEPHECRVLRGAAGSRGPVLVHTDLAELSEPRYRDEIFGPACIVVHGDLDDDRTLNELLFGLNEDRQWGQLVSCVYLSSSDDPQGRFAAAIMQRVCGRLVVNGVPTGVRVATGMVHGGPFPATNVPHTTAVGPRAIERWCRPVCWQNCPDGLLPEELRDGNPRGVMRVVDGVWTREGISRPR